jgi:hypothetical protein
MERRRKYAMFQEWYAIVRRKKPDRILVIDQTLSRAKYTVRMYYPDMDPRELAFRTVSQDEFLEIIAGAAALERPEIQSADYGYEFKVKSLGSHPNN